MISKANYQFLQLQLNFASCLGMTPFKLDHKNKLVSTSHIKSSMIKTYTWFAIVFLSFTIRLCELLSSVSERNGTPAVVVFQSILAGCHFCGVLHFAAVSQKGDDFVKLVNALQNFGRMERSSKFILRNN